jgi:diadenosine tetraphosphatase ApaH/serine/threonine PP2A family protein phosphatase
MRFGESLGEELWEMCNKAFDRLPLAAVIDHEIFCIHGGIPRPVQEHSSEIHAIMSVPKIASIMPAYEYEEEWAKQVRAICLSPRLYSTCII